MLVPRHFMEDIMSNEMPKTDKPQNDKPGVGQPGFGKPGFNKPGQQEQTTGPQGQPNANSPPKPQQG